MNVHVYVTLINIIQAIRKRFVFKNIHKTSGTALLKNTFVSFNENAKRLRHVIFYR